MLVLLELESPELVGAQERIDQEQVNNTTVALLVPGVGRRWALVGKQDSSTESAE